MERTHKYIQFAQTQKLPLHLQPVWLDAVCGPGCWKVCLTVDAQDRICGALPYFITRRFGLSIIRMPPFTDYTGPWLRLPDNPEMKRERRYALEQHIIEDLLGQLPRVHFFNQQYYPGFENWLPFYWRGFHQTTRYTYLLENPGEDTYAGFNQSLRKELRKAAQTVAITRSDDLETFLAVNRLSFARQGLRYPHDPSVLRRLDQALAARGQRSIYLGEESGGGRPCAALYVACDDQTAYFLLSGIDPQQPDKGALHALYWQAIRDCAGRVRRIDFCGSMIPGVEHVLRAFGAERRPHHRVFRAGNRFWRLLAIGLGRDY